jgi:anti-sigma regulatory factor (Ser/Thr protein kinase)
MPSEGTLRLGMEGRIMALSSTDGSHEAASLTSPEEFGVLGFHEYLPTPEEIVSARHFVHETLSASGAQEDVIAAAELVVDEFALNAVRHAGTFFSVSIEEAPGAVRIAVRDDSNAFPEVRDHVVLSISGRGLSIVASTAEQWGAESLGRGKEVWAVLR